MLPTVMLAGGSRLGCQGRLTFQPAELLKIGAGGALLAAAWWAICDSQPRPLWSAGPRRAELQ